MMTAGCESAGKRYFLGFDELYESAFYLDNYMCALHHSCRF